MERGSAVTGRRATAARAGWIALVVVLGGCAIEYAPPDEPRARMAPDADTTLVLAELRSYYRDFSDRNWTLFADHFWSGATITTVWQPPGADAPRVTTTTIPEFVAVAPSHGRFLVEEEHLPEEKVVVIPNGVDTDRFAPVADADAVRGELAIDATAPVVSIVAALRPEKNHELFLEMARRVSDKLPDARFLIIGDGPRREALVQRAEALGIARHVLFLGSRDDVPRLLSATDVFVLTSHNEASPVSILEAMSVGRPVVATDVGSIREVVADGQTGFLVEPGNADQIAGRVCDLLREPLRCQSMGAAARERVVQRWSIDVMVHGYEQMLQSLYDRKTGGGNVPRQDFMPRVISAECTAEPALAATH